MSMLAMCHDGNQNLYCCRSRKVEVIVKPLYYDYDDEEKVLVHFSKLFVI